MGGKQIYEQCLQYVNTIYLTQIDEDYECDVQVNINVDQFKTFSSHTFLLTDTKNNKNVYVTFKKMYFGNIPLCFNSNPEEQQYLDLLKKILDKGHLRQTRNAMVYSLFGENLTFDLTKGFPLLTSKKCYFYGAVCELLFFMKGDTNTTHLSEQNVKFWDGNTSREFLDSVGLNHYEVGTMGPAYGYQLRYYNAEYIDKNTDYTGKGYDQINYCLQLLKSDPNSRRILMTTYNPVQALISCLFPCHGNVIIFNTELKDNLYYLSCMMTQRSADCGSGLYLNVCEYALLVFMFCEVINNDVNYTGFKFTPHKLIMNLGDTHIYTDHYTQIIRQILRNPFKFPKLKIKRKITDLTDFKFEDFELIDYKSYPAILCKMIA